VIRIRFELRGVVQGVGFRPHVARVAGRYTITGFCGNDDLQVFVEAQGEGPEVGAFIDTVLAEAPPLARVTGIAERQVELVPGETTFSIVASRRTSGAITLISPDSATCADCLRELNDPADRRYGYPFITCTNCGPRLSIIRDVPYDRPLTTMAEFGMCPACQAEYTNPLDRRFHAQPISCYDCGPELSFVATSSSSRDEAPPPQDREATATIIAAARQAIAAGKLLAVKGIGGFTLMCDARNPAAVRSLRERKKRPGKPLAVMAGSLEAAQQIARLNPAAEQELTSPQAPIVLAPKAPGYDLAPEVAPGLDDVGVMLPYSPIHHLLLGPDDVLVATSANSSSLPLTYTNEDAYRDLSFVDYFLIHDRPIQVPVEDSVILAAGESIIPIRRSRGYAPLPVRLGNTDRAVLAVGGELKNTFALTRDGMAFLSAHIGDMGSLETQAAFERSVAQLLTMHRRSPELIVVDKHPGYATAAWGEREAERTGARLLRVQHHHAHALSLFAEGAEADTYLVADGTGYGDDGTIWGGEVLTLGENRLEFTREWHLPGFWLPGGDSAIKHPWKSALALAFEYGIEWADGGSPAELALVLSQLENQVGVVRTTSAGRLFDAAAALLGICHTISYEAQAAMELEAIARSCVHTPSTPSSTVESLTHTLIEGVRSGTPVCCLARLFHAELATIFSEAISSIAKPGSTIGLTGGVACNRLFAGDFADALEGCGLTLAQHRIVPPNDGGLALGQALAGYLTLEG
jgi:hydrogenase maturation protein HypF